MSDLTLESPRGAVGAALPVREVRPAKRRLTLSDVWSGLRVARMVGVRDMKLKYKQAALGPVWLLLGPLGMLAAVTVAFKGISNVNTHGVPYVLFALVGLTVWTYVQLTMAIGAQTFIINHQLVRRSPCPRPALVTASLISNAPPAAVMLAAAVLGLAIDRGLPIQALLLPVMVLWLLPLAWSIALIFASVASRYRDIVSIVPLISQAGVFISPVGYPLRGHGFTAVLALNPVSGMIEAWRWCLIGTPPLGYVVAIAGAWTLVLPIVAWRYFTRMETRLADFL